MRTYTESEIAAMRRELAGLPRGSLCRRKSGKGIRYYHKWYEDGVAKGYYVDAAEVEEYRKGIARRRELQKALRACAGRVEAVRSASVVSREMTVKRGAELIEWAGQVAGWQARDVFPDLMKFLRHGAEARVLILYGLRRSGKTTLLQQAVLNLSDEERSAAAYIKVRCSTTLEGIDEMLSTLHGEGFRFVFVDEVTLMPEFIDGASLFSDVYAPMGMKIVLSGTDSLGFWMTLNRELFDRAYFFHTTFVPFAEYSRVLGQADIDDYIRYGGLLRRGETDFDDPRAREKDASFKDEESARFYVDTAIAENIQHSLKFCQDGRYLAHLRELYEAGELTNAINRVIENMNHDFLASVITRDFKSSDLGILKRQLLTDRDPAKRRRLGERMDIEAVTAKLMELLDIRNRPALSVPVKAEHVRQIEAYLRDLDLIRDCPIVMADAAGPYDLPPRILFSQPGLRFAQAQALVFAMMKDRYFAAFPPEECAYVTSRLLSDVFGRMLEDIVLFETLQANPKPRNIFSGRAVFKLQFDSGEFDMVVHDLGANTCELFEIKHSEIRDEGQCRHLSDADKLRYVERFYAPIAARTVLYRGPDADLHGGIRYRNVSRYLHELK